jgi:hypothetical protein
MRNPRYYPSYAIKQWPFDLHGSSHGFSVDVNLLDSSVILYLVSARYDITSLFFPHRSYTKTNIQIYKILQLRLLAHCPIPNILIVGDIQWGVQRNGNYSCFDTSMCPLMTAVHVPAINGKYRWLYIILPGSSGMCHGHRCECEREGTGMIYV